MRSNRTVLTLAAMVVLAMWIAGLNAASNIRVTKHNLSTWGPNTYKSSDYSEICVFCHTPHGSGSWPLWNRAYTPGSFVAYSTVQFNPVRYGGTGLPDATSRLCFSCHEQANTWSSVQLLNPSNVKGNKQPGFANATFHANAALGLDLRDDHPIGFNYVQAQSNTARYELVAKATVEAELGADTFTGDQMTCASCHDVHGRLDSGGNVILSLLRRSNASSLLCFSCHAK